MRNLILSMALWAITVMNYQINAYYSNYFPGDSYDNLIFITVVELFAYIIAGFAFEQFGSRSAAKLFVISFSISLVGAIGILTSDPVENPYLDLTYNYICKFGIAAAFQGVFLSTTVLFPIIFASTTFGICNMMGTISAFASVDVY